MELLRRLSTVEARLAELSGYGSQETRYVDPFDDHVAKSNLDACLHQQHELQFWTQLSEYSLFGKLLSGGTKFGRIIVGKLLF